MMKLKSLGLILLLWLPMAVLSKPNQYREVSSELGFLGKNITGDADKPLIVDSMSGGVLCLDYNNDGYVDVYLVNGARRDGKKTPNLLFRNKGNGHFEEVAKEAGVADLGWGMGGTAADIDNDGDTDLYVTNFGPNRLYRNNGDGTFTDFTQASGTGSSAWSASAAFADLDGDGWVDLYVTNYVDFDFSDPPTSGRFCRFKGRPAYCGPKRYPASRDVLYRNLGNGVFSDVSRTSGIADRGYYGLGVVCTDYDNDGDLDVYVANDSVPNNLFQNNGRGQFKDVALQAGVAVDANGKEQAGMGVDAGDYDNDGWMDLYVTNFSEEYNTLYRNLGNGFFIDSTRETGLAQPTMSYLGFGTGFIDFNRDGRVDLFVANGHLYPNVPPYSMPDQWFLNIGNSQFRDVSNQAFPSPTAAVGRGAAFVDLDNDGSLEIVVSILDDQPLVYRRDQLGNHWLGLRLQGTCSNGDALGTRVFLSSKKGGPQQMREVRSSSSYCSQNDPRILFGVPDGEAALRVEIRWPSGKISVLKDLKLNRYHEVVEPACDEPG